MTLPPSSPPNERPSAPAAPPSPHDPRCANCGEPLHGVYCAACGQRDEPLRQPLPAFLKEAFIEFLGVDGRLWRSLWLLLFRPGHLTTAYLAGHRVRHIRPLRLYLIASLLFFFLLSVIDPVGRFGFGSEPAPADTTLSAGAYRALLDARLAGSDARLARQEALVDSLEARLRTDSLALTTAPPSPAEAQREAERTLDNLRDEWLDERRDLTRLRQRIEKDNRQIGWIYEQIASAPADSLLRPADLERAAALLFDEAPGTQLNLDLPDWLPRSEAVRQMRAARTGAEMRSAVVAFSRDVLRRLPSVMFLMLPLFALLLKLLYLRRDWYYSEHLVFGLHTHAFAFLLFTLMLLLTWASGGAGWANTTASLLSLWIPVYFFLAQRKVYRQGWLKTAGKAWLLGWMYLFVLNVGLVAALMLAAAL